jgi:hypothetical protein
MDLILNELSLTVPRTGIVSARASMQTLIRVSRALAALGFERTLRTPRHWTLCTLADNYLVAQWLNDGGVEMENRLFVKTMATKSPFLEEILADMIKEFGLAAEFYFNERACTGLGVAYMQGGPAVSIDGAGDFAQDPVVINAVGECGGEIVETTFEVCCISRVEQVVAREIWLRERV